MTLTYEDFMTIKGFNEKTIFCKFINENHKYKLGINENLIKFDPTKPCKVSSLCFTTKENIHNFINYGNNLATIELCSDALYYIADPDYNEFETNKFKILKIEHGDEILEHFVQLNGYVLEHIKNQTEEMCILAVQQVGCALQHVKNQTEKICILAVQQDSGALEYVKNQTEKICKIAVQKDGLSLNFVKNQTDEICILAVQQDSDALEYVKNQTDEICKLAVRQNGYVISYIKNPTDEICEIAIKKQMDMQYNVL